MLKVKFVEATETAALINALMKDMEKEDKVVDFAHIEQVGDKLAIWYEVK